MSMKEKLNVDLRAATLKQLRSLQMVVQEGSYARAAKMLHLTPPAVTLQMQQLESVVGLALIERSDDGFRPTEAGRELLQAINRIDAELKQCTKSLEALSGVNSGRVSVGIISTAKYFAPRALASFVDQHPDVDVRISVGNRQDTIEALRNYEVDFAIMGRPPKSLDIESAIIGDNPHIVICPPKHPLINECDITIADVADETFLLREEGSGTRRIMEKLFTNAGVNPTMGMEIGSNETIKQAVMAGLGVALLSAHTVEAELVEKRLGMLDVYSLPIIRQWFLVMRQGKRLLPSPQALWDFLAKSGKDYLPILPGVTK